MVNTIRKAVNTIQKAVYIVWKAVSTIRKAVYATQVGQLWLSYKRASDRILYRGVAALSVAEARRASTVVSFVPRLLHSGTQN